MSIDYELATYDDMALTKNRLEVSLSSGTTTANARRNEAARPSEGNGLPHQLSLLYRNTEEYRTYASARNWGANHVAYPSETLTNEVYDIYVINHCHNRVATSGMPSFSPHQTILALVNTERAIGVSPYSTGVANPQKTYLEALLNAVGAEYNVPGPINL